jgi:hypothetical protein
VFYLNDIIVYIPIMVRQAHHERNKSAFSWECAG